VRLAALVLPLTAAVLAAAAMRIDARSATTVCNTAYKGLKTLSDPQRKQVNLQPKDTTLAAIAQLPRPQPTPTTRTTPFERQVWRVIAEITEYRLEADSDIHLVLFNLSGSQTGAGVYGIAEMPAASCLPKKARDRTAIIKARHRFVTHCGHPTSSWKPLGAVVKISGVGFWDKPHSQKPHAPNFAELHPVTGITFIAGCGRLASHVLVKLSLRARGTVGRKLRLLVFVGDIRAVQAPALRVLVGFSVALGASHPWLNLARSGAVAHPQTKLPFRSPTEWLAVGQRSRSAHRHTSHKVVRPLWRSRPR
jgi:hypothetical protein